MKQLDKIEKCLKRIAELESKHILKIEEEIILCAYYAYIAICLVNSEDQKPRQRYIRRSNDLKEDIKLRGLAYSY